MERRIFVVLLLMAAVAACGSDRFIQPMGFDGQHFVGPVCLPGDPCGPWPGANPLALGPRVSVENFSGPMCFPGDPCGSGLSSAYLLQGASGIGDFSGPMCFPGDPCGSGGMRQVFEVAGLHTRRDIKPLPVGDDRLSGSS